MRNAVLRGDLRARSSSRKVLVMELLYVGMLASLMLLGLPPELNQAAPTRNPVGLALALVGVQLVLVTYFASACAVQEIAVEGERPAIDLAFGPFSRLTIVSGKSLTSLTTVAYWLLLGAPLLVFASGIRQAPAGRLAAVLALAAVEAWAVAQVGTFYSVVFESELARTLAHWGTLVLLFVGTLALPAQEQWTNPVIAATRAVAGPFPIQAAAAYAAFGLASGGLAWGALRRFGGT